MKKLMFSILPALLLALVSCMNTSQESEGGSVRVVLPSSSRALYSSGHGDVDSFTVRLLLGEKIINEKSITKDSADTGGAIVFDELEPATYTVEVEGWMSSKDVLLYFGSEEAKVTAGQDTSCQVNLKKDCQIYNNTADAEELKTACESDGNAYIFMGGNSSVSTNQATSDNNQLANITSGTKIIRGNGGKVQESTDDNKTLATEGGQIKLFNVTGRSTILEINNLTFTASSTVGTTSTLDGALICVDDGATVILKQCLIKDISISNGDTSLIYVKNGGKLLLENCTFYNNTSTLERNSVGYSECIRIDNGAQVEVVSCNFDSNGHETRMSNSAAIENSGSCHITNTTFKGNTANRGGAIMNNENGILEIENSTFDSNMCTSNSGYYARRGGAIFIQGGTVKITDSTFTGNKAGGNNPGNEGEENNLQMLGGGAISIKTGSLVLQNTRFDSNSVTSTTANSTNTKYGYGGAVLIEQSDASLLLKNASGAAMDIESYTNKYMSGNKVGTGKEGANIYCNGGTINGTVYTKAWE